MLVFAAMLINGLRALDDLAPFMNVNPILWTDFAAGTLQRNILHGPFDVKCLADRRNMATNEASVNNECQTWQSGVLQVLSAIFQNLFYGNLPGLLQI